MMTMNLRMVHDLAHHVPALLLAAARCRRAVAVKPADGRFLRPDPVERHIAESRQELACASAESTTVRRDGRFLDVHSIPTLQTPETKVPEQTELPLPTRLAAAPSIATGQHIETPGARLFDTH